MAEILLNPEARRENARALAVAAGVSEEEAAVRLDRPVRVTYDDVEPIAGLLAGELITVLGRSLPVYGHETNTRESVAAEVVIGHARPRTEGPHVFAVLIADSCIISRRPVEFEAHDGPHPLLVTIAACYMAGAVIRCVVGDGLRNPPPEEFEIPFDAFIPPGVDLSSVVDLEEAYLAGAGAIGNGLLWAAHIFAYAGGCM